MLYAPDPHSPLNPEPDGEATPITPLELCLTLAQIALGQAHESPELLISQAHKQGLVQIMPHSTHTAKQAELTSLGNNLETLRDKIFLRAHRVELEHQIAQLERQQETWFNRKFRHESFERKLIPLREEHEQALRTENKLVERFDRHTTLDRELAYFTPCALGYVRLLEAGEEYLRVNDPNGLNACFQQHGPTRNDRNEGPLATQPWYRHHYGGPFGNGIFG